MMFGCVLMLGGVTVDQVPDDPDKLVNFAKPIKTSLEDVLGGDQEVEIVSIDGVPVPTTTKTTTKTTAAADGVVVDFNVLVEIACDSDCSSVLASAGDVAKAVVDRVAASMSNGSFLKALKANAADLGVDSLTDATVNASSFEVGGEPTFAAPPSAAPTEEEAVSFLAAVFWWMVEVFMSLLGLA